MQRFQTKKIYDASNVDPKSVRTHVEGLEFVRTWDSIGVSVISLVPFGLSLAFAGAWIGVSIQQYGVNAQVATQTAFTVAAYIVTAGMCFDWIFFSIHH
jgi:hypothetical protein